MAYSKLPVGFLRWKQKSKWAWVSLSEDKWQFIKVRQPLNLQSWGTSEEILPVEMVNAKAVNKFSCPGTHDYGYSHSRQCKWNWNKYEDNHKKRLYVMKRNAGQVMQYSEMKGKRISEDIHYKKKSTLYQRLEKEIGITELSWKPREC